MFVGSCYFIFYFMYGFNFKSRTFDHKVSYRSWNFQSFKASYRLHLVSILTRTEQKCASEKLVKSLRESFGEKCYGEDKLKLFQLKK